MVFILIPFLKYCNYIIHPKTYINTLIIINQSYNSLFRKHVFFSLVLDRLLRSLSVSWCDLLCSQVRSDDSNPLIENVKEASFFKNKMNKINQSLLCEIHQSVFLPVLFVCEWIISEKHPFLSFSPQRCSE